MKPWKRDLAYIREVGPDEPRFDEAVQRVWDHCQRLENALSHIANRTHPATYVGIVDGLETYGAPDDASRFAQRILNGEQVS